jgi:hypothetical protein
MVFFYVREKISSEAKNTAHRFADLSDGPRRRLTSTIASRYPRNNGNDTIAKAIPFIQDYDPVFGYT